MKKLFLVLLFALTACGPSAPAKEILLVSTTSTQDSGLLDVLLPAFTEQTGYKVRLIAAGSGQALEIAKQGNADVILLHSPAAEKQFVADGWGMDRRLVMHNDFVIIGPVGDPAKIRGRTPEEAFKAIFASGATFISRGDNSGTHVKELALWEKAGLDPTGQAWYLETGQGQGATISIASEKDGYSLVDSSTFFAYEIHVENMRILVKDDPFLLNVYHVIIVNPQKWPHINLAGALAFADFITSTEGQKIIGEFGEGDEAYGQPLFIPDADKTDADLGLP